MRTEATSIYGYMIRSGTVRYRCGSESGDVDVSIGRPPRSNGTDLTAWCSLSAENGGLRATLLVKNLLGLPVEILSARLETNLFLPSSARVFANGWQSRSASGLVRIADGLPSPRFARAPDLACGDYALVRYGPGRVHSWTYTWFRSSGRFSFAGALDESIAFTRFEFAAVSSRGPASLSVHADCEGLVLPPLPKSSTSPQTPCRLADVFLIYGEEEPCVAGYFDLRRRTRREPGGRKSLHRTPGAPALAWDGGPDAELPGGAEDVASLLAPFRTLEIPLDYLFLGGHSPCAEISCDGSGGPVLKALAPLFADVRAAGVLPGLSLSPFVCPRRSSFYIERKEFLAQDARGRLLRVGSYGSPDGPLYVLDFYRPAYRRHLEQVFRALSAAPGVGILRLSHLHAATLLGGAGTGRTRAQALQDAIRLLQDLCGPLPMVAADVPLGAVFDAVGYASVAPPASPALYGGLLQPRLRERGGVEEVIRTLAGRRHLDGRAFRSDPGPFTLRRPRRPSDETDGRRLFLACTLFGGLLSTSDAVSGYTSAALGRFRDVVLRRGTRLYDKRVHAVTEKPDGSMLVEYELRGERLEAGIDPPTRKR